MRIAVVDIETTARTPNKGTIVEIGVCMLDLKTHFITQLLDTTCCEKDFLTKFESKTLEESWVFNNSDLKIKEILNGPKWENIIPKLNKIFEKFPATAYNKAFDLTWFRKHGATVPRELPCPMIEGTPILKIPHKNNSRGGYKWPSVQESWDYFFPDDKDYIEAHRAYDDAEHEAEIIYQLYKLGAWKPEITHN